jgi:hypothetical protein
MLLSLSLLSKKRDGGKARSGGFATAFDSSVRPSKMVQLRGASGRTRSGYGSHVEPSGDKVMRPYHPG